MALLPPQRPQSRAERTAYVSACAGVFVLDAGYELLRVALDRPWRGVAPALSHFVSLSLGSLWIAAALALAILLRQSRYFMPALYLGIAGTFGMVAHGAVTRVFGNPVGLVNWALAALQIVLLRKVLVRRNDEPGKRARVPTARA